MAFPRKREFLFKCKKHRVFTQRKKKTNEIPFYKGMTGKYKENEDKWHSRVAGISI